MRASSGLVTLLAALSILGCSTQPARNPAHTDLETAAVSPEYAYLRQAGIVAVECGNGSPTSEVWRQLYRLVEARRLGELRMLASSRVPELRALGIIGLYKAGAYPRPTAEALLSAIKQPVMACSGCIISPTDPKDLIEMLNAPSPASLAAVGRNWRTPTETVDLPGTPRIAIPD